MAKKPTKKKVETAPTDLLHLSPKDVTDLYLAYKKAVKGGKKSEETITFQGSKFALGYLKYMLMYLKDKFPDAKIKQEEVYKL